MDKKEEGLPYPQMKHPSIDSTEVLTKDGKINWNLVECMHCYVIVTIRQNHERIRILNPASLTHV